LITQVEEWMLYDKYVQDNPLDYEEYMVHHANQMIEVKGKFIEMCKSMLEKEKEVIEDAYNEGQESKWGESMGLMGDHYYNETFKTK